MSTSSESSLFRLFVVGWMSLSGVGIFLLMLLSFLDISQSSMANIMCVIPLFLLGLLIYAYVKSKDVLLRRLCYSYMIIGIPCLLLMFIAPMMMS
ncbi:MAG TPA: hypothetical protein VGV92_09665 [Gammaproteobacteria bacterium]|nr:hypothetical protein [Gammaproteobacteria bacterium]